MSEFIDKRIAALENELSGLRRQKLVALLSEVAALQASLAGAPGAAGQSGAGGPRKMGRPRKTDEATGAPTARPRKRRGRRHGKRISDQEALGMLRNAVAASGSEGLSARAASDSAGVFYPRTIKLLKGNFKRAGAGRWTRYSLK